MPSTYSTNLKIELIPTGAQSGVWGVTTNANLGTAIEQARAGDSNSNGRVERAIQDLKGLMRTLRSALTIFRAWRKWE